MNKKSPNKKRSIRGIRVPVVGFVVSKIRIPKPWHGFATVLAIAVTIYLIVNVVVAPFLAKRIADITPEATAVRATLQDEYPKKVSVIDQTFYGTGVRILNVTITVENHINHDESMKIREKVCAVLGDKAKNYDEVILHSIVEKRFSIFFSRDNKSGSIRCNQFKNSQVEESKNKKPELTKDDFAPVIDRAANSIMKIEAHGCGDGIYISTGFVVAPHLLVITAHGVAGTDEVYVLWGDRNYPAKVVAFDDTRDVAVIRVNSLAGSPLNLHKRATLSIYGERFGEKMFFAGYPAGGNFTPMLTAIAEEGMGVIFDASGAEHDLNVYMLETPAQPGNSGSPLIDIKGEVVGMVHGSSLVTGENGRGHVVPSEAFLEYVEQAKNLHDSVNTGMCAPIPGQ